MLRSGRDEYTMERVVKEGEKEFFEFLGKKYTMTGILLHDLCSGNLIEGTYLIIMNV